MEIHRHMAVLLCLGLGSLGPGLSVARSSPGSGQAITHAESTVPGLHDFDSWWDAGKSIIES